MARVLSLEEVIASKEPVVAEWIGFQTVEFATVTVDSFRAPGVVTFDKFTRARTENAYGNQWRCWDEKPDDEDLKREGRLPVRPIDLPDDEQTVNSKKKQKSV